jgi:hypothetical protein
VIVHAAYCPCCQFTLVAPVNFCPRCGTDQRMTVSRPVPAVATAALPAMARSDTVVYLILGWVFAALAMATVSPLVFGPAALVMGALAWSHGSRQGMAIVFVSIAAATIGFLLSYAFSVSPTDALSTADVSVALLPR